MKSGRGESISRSVLAKERSSILIGQISQLGNGRVMSGWKGGRAKRWMEKRGSRRDRGRKTSRAEG